ncbi:MAG: hypothetical protein JWP01_305 [Myxococcales bacterium]|nr:hypothetical protein [Myxococcales bacterium]
MHIRSRSMLLAMLVSASSFAEPPRAPEEDRAPPTRTALTAGAIIFLTSYGLSIGIGSQSLDEDHRGLYVPVAGPWLVLADRSDDDKLTDALLAIDGIAQATGALIIVGALIARTEPRRPESQAARKQLIRITPIMTRDRPGIAFSGTF